MNSPADKFKSMEQSALQQYMSDRLSEETNDPPAHTERGVSPEDILIQYYRYDDLSDDRRAVFWRAWRVVASKAFDDRKLPLFQNTMALAYALPRPAEADKLVGFLPRNVDHYDVTNYAEYDFHLQILKLFLAWEIILKDNKFWRPIYKNYLLKIKNGAEPLPPLITAYKGLGKLNREDVKHTMHCLIGSANERALILYSSLMEDQMYRFYTADKSSQTFPYLVAEAWNAEVMSSSAPRQQNNGETSDWQKKFRGKVHQETLRIIEGKFHLSDPNENPNPGVIPAIAA